MNMQTHKDLDVWKLGIELVEDIYLITRKFPKDEMYGLTSQLRRSSVSVPSNIAEGYARNYNKELLQYLYHALGSISEMETQLIISVRLKYLENEKIIEKVELVRKMLINLIKYHRSKGK